MSKEQFSQSCSRTRTKSIFDSNRRYHAGFAKGTYPSLMPTPDNTVHDANVGLDEYHNNLGRYAFIPSVPLERGEDRPPR